MRLAVNPAAPIVSSMSEFAVGPDSTMNNGTQAPVSTAWGTANMARGVPFYLLFPFFVRRLWWLNGATISGNVDCGIYTRAGTKICATGSTAQANANVVQSAVPSAGSVLLLPDSYYMVLGSSSATATFFGYTSFAESVVSQTTAFALPTSFVPTASSFPGGILLPVFGFADVAVI